MNRPQISTSTNDQRRQNKIAFLLILGVILIGIVAFFRYATSPVNPLCTAKIVDIPQRASFNQVTQILNDADLIGNRPCFWALALIKRANRNIRAGTYELTGAMTPSAILDKLVRGEIKVYAVLLPEDITANEVSRRLSDINLINEKEFLALAVDRSFLASLDIKADSIEGYLYPDTYRFDKSMTTEDVIRMLVGRFWKQITPEMRKRAKEIGLSINEWVTLASIIGKETVNDEEKPLISAVFHNWWHQFEYPPIAAIR